MNNKREAVYDVRWQLLRLSFLHRWDTDTAAVLDQCRRYVAEVSQDTPEMLHRVWRVVNLLAAVKRAGRGGLPVRRAYAAWKKDLAQLERVHQYQDHDWEKVAQELALLRTHGAPKAYEQLRRNLVARSRKGVKPEVQRFLGLMT